MSICDGLPAAVSIYTRHEKTYQKHVQLWLYDLLSDLQPLMFHLLYLLCIPYPEPHLMLHVIFLKLQ